MGVVDRRKAAVVLVLGVLVLIRPGTGAGRALRRELDRARRRLRYLGGQLEGVSYRMGGGGPDPNVPGTVLADRVRSTLGPLEKRLDLPHVHVLVEDHVVLLHGEVGSADDADEIETAVAAISGVRGVESHLHVGFVRGDSRPSAGRAVDQPSTAQRRLLQAAAATGLEEDRAPSAVRAVLAAFAERLPPGEREQVAGHLPGDVRSMFTPPPVRRRGKPARRVEDLLARVSSAGAVPREGDSALEVVQAVLGELRALVPEEAVDVAAVLPAELRSLWEPATTGGATG